MPATTSATGHDATRARRHPDCWVCAPGNGHGLTVSFQADETGAVTGTFACDAAFVGYPRYLHGGVTSALLDGAMTNCLLARGTPGLTARLEVRYRQPVLLGKTATIRAWLEKSRGPLHILAADLRQKGEVVATASGRFMSYPEAAPPNGEGEPDEENRHRHL